MEPITSQSSKEVVVDVKCVPHLEFSLAPMWNAKDVILFYVWIKRETALNCITPWITKDKDRWLQARSKHKMTGGAERVAHINSPPPASVPGLKHTSWYMSNHYICLQYLLFLSLIFRLCWLWRNRELVWDIFRGKLFFDSDCFFDYTRLCVTRAWFYPR